MTLPVFDHLVAMSSDIGTFEHADHASPRRSHGYCVDDVARVLVVVAREPYPTAAVDELGRTAFRFLADAQGVGGLVRNRRSAGGRWEHRQSAEDCWGRSLWAFGTTVRLGRQPWMRQQALSCFERGAEQTSTWPRAMAFAALGAADVVAVAPRNAAARDVLDRAITTIGPLAPDPDWPWPEPRLTYSNASLPEALIAAGDALAQPDVTATGLALLEWLLDRETADGHLSVTPVGGAGPLDVGPAFDQQPIEAGALADACARALQVTGDRRWRRGIDLAAAWFAGHNDAGVVMWDAETGGGYDGLHATGANLNQGAESTIALISTRQQARDLTLTSV